MAEGWHGWDEYAAFYDWENARTVGRRDVTFWRGLAARAKGRVLELGCGTGRVLVPVARDGRRIVGIDRSTPMLDRAAPSWPEPGPGRGPAHRACGRRCCAATSATCRAARRRSAWSWRPTASCSR